MPIAFSTLCRPTLLPTRGEWVITADSTLDPVCVICPYAFTEVIACSRAFQCILAHVVLYYPRYRNAFLIYFSGPVHTWYQHAYWVILSQVDSSKYVSSHLAL